MNSAPKFWNDRNFISSMLIPLSWLWRAVTAMRLAWIKPEFSSLPVFCVGNISVGGTGKTPFVGYLCQLLRQQGYRPFILTRGYGGRLKGPVFADATQHNASEIGDEALMLCQNEHVCISRDRVAGARLIELSGLADVIIMDDGMQNPWLGKDVTIAVFDGESGLGNGRILPAGPLRQTLSAALPTTDIAVINGADKTGLIELLPKKLPQLKTKLIPNPENAAALAGRPVVGFAGIGRPKRFFDSLEQCGAHLVKALPFADHHAYSEADLTRLHLEATQLGAELITTRKDWVRLSPEWRERVMMLDVSFDLSEAAIEKLGQVLKPYLEKQDS